MAALAALAAACGPDENAPILTHLRCANADRCQSPQNPFLLELAVDFSDPDGDFATGNGIVRVLVDDKVRQVSSASQWFTFSGLEPAATRGTLRFDLEVELSTVEDGQLFVIGVDATDAQGHESNRPTLSMEVSL